MDRQREVFFGKLAIGRGVMSRETAIRCFYAARGEPFWEIAIREGRLARTQADDILKVIDLGTLVCRGTCGARSPLGSARPEEADRCSRCGGILYVHVANAEATQEMPGPQSGSIEALREQFVASQAAAARGNGGTKPAPLGVALEEFDDGFSPELPTMPPVAPSRAVVDTSSHHDSHPSQAPDSLPSAIPIPAPLDLVGGASASIPRGAEETKKDMAQEEAGFTPFILDNYEVLAPIGKGGMGSVYRARQRSLDRLVAIKILTQANEDQRARFDREIKATAALNHPNIVKVIGGGVYKPAGETEGRPYFAMEFVPGRDLGKWMREQPRSAGTCTAIMVTLCDAMHYAHNRGIIHRDLKPQNVLVTNEGDIPKICDFGLAKVAESNLTRTGDVMGTPQYMPPEQILGDRKKIGPPSDVYGLGAILYHLLAGVPPFHSKKIFALTAMVVKDPPVPLRVKNPSVPADLEAAVLKALEKDPIKRFHTARDFGRALAALNLPR